MTYPAHVRDGLLGHTKRTTDNPVFSDQPFKLGVFSLNCSGGMIMSEAETGFRITWDQQLEIARAADRGGLDALVPVGRWTGFRGDTNFNGVCFETYTWAAGLAQATENIGIFTTTHVPTVHPIVAAKMATTIDHISNGRFGMNLVMGWFTPEMEMFGRKQLEHDKRYEYGQEWLDFAMRLWNEEGDFDFEGAEFFSSKGAHAYPKPIQAPRPALLNAGASPRGQQFSAKNVDINLIALPTEEVPDYVRSIKGTAQNEYDRDIDVWTYALVICRETEAEAKRVQQDIIDKGDWPGANIIMETLGIESQSFGTQIREMQERFIAGWGGPNIVGTPEQVAEQLGEYQEAGMAGAVFGFLDYAKETQEFCDEVLPIMKKNGLRH
ncbi:LLM class flavin-dependent oxidoreductase [Actinomycetospora soli]|uniref:LLM class flavin-dependent oxidoreductase n=1 Tax=Actinomycetospora soli TaxID=2893887 RepID=UPI001E41B51A|nr:LLM class flavin-dependent oxidoreductase [Actinomycetospora soli]MCD2185735.1 LLM class flavin-dependent oxidoreductase [Actinomycetospora soli]